MFQKQAPKRHWLRKERSFTDQSPSEKILEDCVSVRQQRHS